MEKQAPAYSAPAPGQQAWDPKAPHGNEQLGSYQPNNTAKQPGVNGGMHLKPVQQPDANPGFPTVTYCPVTGGAHQPHETCGMVGIIIGIFFCPCGLIATCMDKKIYCEQCRFVIQPGWGG